VFEQVRQLAAIEMRKRVSSNSGNLWLQVTQSDREQLKTQLPEMVLRESKLVSFSPIILDLSR
jgi:importin-4